MKAHEIKTKFPVQIALELKKVFAEEFSRIQGDRMLSYEGKQQEIVKVKESFALDLFQFVVDEKKKYVKLANDAVEIAKEIKVQGFKEPGEVELKLFNQAMDRMESDVMLSVNEERALEKLEVFVKQYAEPYFASVILEKFGVISLNILNIKSSPAVRTSLNKIREELEAVITTPQIAAANEAIERYADAENVKLFKHNTPAYNTVREIIGGVASHLLDDPAKGLAVLNGEASIFANKPGTNVMQMQ